MTDDPNHDDPDEALTEILKILESDTLLKTEFDEDLETLWSDTKDVRDKFRGL